MQNTSSTYSSANLLEHTLNQWKHQEQSHYEVRVCKLTPIARTNVEFKLELIITTALMVNGRNESVSVKAEPFYTKTLAIMPACIDSLGECNKLKKVMKALDEEFERLVNNRVL